jgi:hypothetical protein
MNTICVLCKVDKSRYDFYTNPSICKKCVIRSCGCYICGNLNSIYFIKGYSELGLCELHYKKFRNKRLINSILISIAIFSIFYIWKLF